MNIFLMLVVAFLTKCDITADGSTAKPCRHSFLFAQFFSVLFMKNRKL